MTFEQILPILKAGGRATNSEYLGKQYIYFEQEHGATVIKSGDELGLKATWHAFDIDEVLSDKWEELK